jgi:Bardet-Biedl syndrome 1 protein
VHPPAPAIAVASGASLFVYKNLKPYYKFNLPASDVNETEQEVWQHVASGELDENALSVVLENLRQQV